MEVIEIPSKVSLSKINNEKRTNEKNDKTNGLIEEEFRTSVMKASGFAFKLRKMLFARLIGKLEGQDIARLSGTLNQLIYKYMLDKKIPKDAYVRISFRLTIDPTKDDIVQNLIGTKVMIELFEVKKTNGFTISE